MTSLPVAAPDGETTAPHPPHPTDRVTWQGVLGQMPRQILQEIAVSQVVLPAALFAALGYLLPQTLLGRRLTERRSRAGIHRFTARWQYPRSGFLLLAAVLVVPGTISWYAHSGDKPYGVIAPPGWMIALAALAATP